MGKEQNKSQAFSLIELLVVVAVTATLAAILAASAPRAIDAIDRHAASHNLRQIGVALHQFAADNNGLAPGPMWPGQIPIINLAREGRLARKLAPYLDVYEVTTGVEVSHFVPPAYRKRFDTTDVAEPRTYVLNMAAPMPDGRLLNVWGALTTDPPIEPKLLALAPATAWAVSDADREHPRVRGAPWRNSTPPEPIHGAKRQALLFGGAVVLLSEADLE